MSRVSAGTSNIIGANFEVMSGQADLRIRLADALTICDNLQLAGWRLHRLAKEPGIAVTSNAKSSQGGGNRAGMHAELSTCAMRESGISPPFLTEEQTWHTI